MRFRLRLGGHEQAPPNWKPSEADLEREKTTGIPTRVPVQRFKAGETFEGPTDAEGKEIDLVQRFGGEKFEYVDSHRARQIDVEQAYPKASGEQTKGDPTIFAGAERAGYRHPGGQVVEGFQGSETNEQGQVVTGLKQEKPGEKRSVSPPQGHEAAPGSAPVKGSAPAGSTTAGAGEAPKLGEAQRGQDTGRGGRR
jgi:hypothetical protein